MRHRMPNPFAYVYVIIVECNDPYYGYYNFEGSVFLNKEDAEKYASEQTVCTAVDPDTGEEYTYQVDHRDVVEVKLK